MEQQKNPEICDEQEEEGPPCEICGKEYNFQDFVGCCNGNDCKLDSMCDQCAVFVDDDWYCHDCGIDESDDYETDSE